MAALRVAVVGERTPASTRASIRVSILVLEKEGVAVVAFRRVAEVVDMVAIGAMATAASTVVIRDMVKEVDGVTMVGEVVVILADSTKTRHHQFKLRILTRTRWLAIRRGDGDVIPDLPSGSR
jgi:hypothetical protein